MTYDSTSGPRLTPGPTCSVYAPLLPLLHTGELTVEQAASTQEHLANCAFCRTRLAEYDTLYVALRARFDPDVMTASVRIPVASEIAQLSGGSRSGSKLGALGPRVSDDGESERDELAARGYVVRRRVPRWFEAVAAVLLISLLGGVLLWQRGSGLGGPPPLDAQSQTYVAILRADYLPLLDAIGAESRQCVAAFDGAPASDKSQAMTDCRPLEAAAQTASQTLLDHLQAASAPARWKSADEHLKAWAQDEVAFYGARIQAIDAQDVGKFKQLGDQGADDQSECAAIVQINADLPADAQLPSNAAGYCG